MANRFWIGHARGCDFARLREKGFLTLYPTIDDYVFLEETDANQKFLGKQIELGLYFLKKKGKLITVSQEEIQRMTKTSTDKINLDSEILVVQGPGAGLDGIVSKIEGNKVTGLLNGYARKYELVMDLQDVVIKPQVKALQA